MAKVITIQQCIKEIDPRIDYRVSILDGCVDFLVKERYLCGENVTPGDHPLKRNNAAGVGYQINREIKYWSTFFLLKALTTTSLIQNWRSQRSLILQFLQMREPTFYHHLKVLKEKKLLSIEGNRHIKLCSFEQAADILGIAYTGVVAIPYNPNKHNGQQAFQYQLRAEEIRQQQHRQLKTLCFKLAKNPPLRNKLFIMLAAAGSDEQRLYRDPLYLQERLLQLQMQLFRHGSDNLVEVMERRADINRNVRSIQRDHTYKGASSVSYIKRKMFDLRIIDVQKIAVESKVRSRFYVPDPDNDQKKARLKKKLKARFISQQQYELELKRLDQETGNVKDGYKYNDRSKATTWFLTDQIKINYDRINEPAMQAEKKVA